MEIMNKLLKYICLVTTEMRTKISLILIFLFLLGILISKILFAQQEKYFVNQYGDEKKESFFFGRRIDNIEDFIVKHQDSPVSSQLNYPYPLNSLEHDKKGRVNAKEQFTIVIFTHSTKRSQLLFEILSKLSGLAQLNQIIIIWSNRDLPDDSDWKWPKLDCKLSLLHSKRDSLNDRFFPLNIIETDAVLSMDDDVFVSHEDLLFAFNVWQEFPERIVGFLERGVSWENGKWNYVRHSNTVSIVLTSLSFFHKKYLYFYTYEMPEVIRNKIDGIVNCEDIAMNLLVSHITHKAPLKVTTLQTANCVSCNNTRGEELSKRSSHKEQRSECLNFFANVYGYLPLFKSNYRLVDLSQNTSCGT